MREIKGPEDCIPHDDCDAFIDSMRGRESVDAWFTAQEVGQIIELVRSDTQVFAEDPTKENCESMMAWLTLAKKLKGGNNGCDA